MIKMEIDAECPACGHKVDSASAAGETEATAIPEPGDFALCIRCAEPGVYAVNPDGQTLGLRAASEAEKVALSEREDVIGVQAAICAVSGKWLS